MLTHSPLALARVILALICLLGVLPAHAEDLYGATVRVADRSEEAKDIAIRAAMGQVLVKLSGDGAANRWAASQGGLEGAAEYVDQETYVIRERRQPSEGFDPSLPTDELFLKVRFSSRYVDQLLRRLDLPLWAANRAPVLVWLAVQSQQSERRMASDEDALLREALDLTAEARGLAVLHPVMDLVDMQSVDAADVWGFLWEDLTLSSERYGTPLIVAVGLEERGALWQANWSLRDGDDTVNWTSRGADDYDALASGFETVADTLGDRYAVRPGDFRSSEVTAIIAGVESVAQYGQTMKLLTEHSLVDGVRVVAMRDGELELMLKLNAATDSFISSLARSGVLRPLSDESLEVTRFADILLEAL